MTMEQRYKTPQALDAAVTQAAKSSPQDTGRAKSDFLYDRFLERVFSEPNPRFVLKGGRSILARTLDARRTLDVDFAYRGEDLDAAAEELVSLASKDMGDFYTFRYIERKRVAEGQEYRHGYKLRFNVFFGATRDMGNISVDLVAGPVVGEGADAIAPVNRLAIKGLSASDYLVIPVPLAIADKVRATMQTYPDGARSSRVKDLVDIVIYALAEEIDAGDLAKQIKREARLRGMTPIAEFEVPQEWHDLPPRGKRYAKDARSANIPAEYCDIDAAEKLAKLLIDPALSGTVKGKRWNPSAVSWC